MSSERTSYPIKEYCHALLKESRSHSADRKLFEFIDDHSYCNAENVGFHIEMVGQRTKYIYAFMDKGPTDINTMNKLFEWRKSGKSDEIGHQGGGNKRFFYGHYSKLTELITEVSENKYIYCSTKPKNIYDFSKEEVSESEFKDQINTDRFTVWPTECTIAPNWFTEYKNREDIPFKPKYMVRMELDEYENEYKKKEDWNSFVNRIRMKNYYVNVYMRNELITDMEDTNNFNVELANIDTLGFYEHIEYDSESGSESGSEGDFQSGSENTIKHYIEDSMLELDLYINSNDIIFVEHNDKYYTKYETNSKKEYKYDEKIPFGKLYQYLVDDDHIKEQIEILNTESNDSFREGDFYGVWMMINNKQIDSLPMTTIQLPDAKNNRIDGHGSTKFRWLIVPYADNEIIEKVIRTETIKANTYFKDTHMINQLIRTTMNIYKEVRNKPKIKKKTNPYGAGYLLFIHKHNGKMLLKYGYVVDYKKINNRLSQHKKSYKKVINEFLHTEVNSNLHDQINFIYQTPPIREPSSFENTFHSFLEDNRRDNLDKLTLFSSGRTKKEDREYFICNDFDFLQEYIINPISEHYNENVCC